MADTFHVEFVLVRGPTALDRRLRVALPVDGTPVTVGRAAHCGVLLDPTLLFSSQVHCSLFAMRAKTAAHTTAASPSAGAAPPPPPPLSTDDVGGHGDGTAATADEAQRSAADAVMQTPQQQRGSGDAGRSSWCVYVTDLCSSNGTFVNGTRISGTDPTPLHHGDVCIFGGMRDVEVGAALPADAYPGPELVQWRVDLHTGVRAATEEAFDFTATPLVLPAHDLLAAEAHALMTTVQRSLGKTAAAAALLPLSTPTPTPGAVSGRAASSGRRSGAHREESPPGVPQQLFASPQTEERARPPTAVEAADENREGEAQRSASRHRSASLVTPLQDVVVARSVSPAAEDGPAPAVVSGAAAAPAAAAELPVPVVYDIVRLGNVTFDARCAGGAAATAVDAAEEGDNAEEAVTGAKRPRAASVASRTRKNRRADPSSTPEGATAAAAPAGPASVTALLTCTPSHLKWIMANPSDLMSRQQQHQQRPGSPGDEGPDAPAREAAGGPRRAFYGMLPVTSIATVVACPARRGLAVELRDGCVLPLVAAEVLRGSAESRWVVWTLSAAAAAPASECAEAVAETATSSSRGAAKTAKGRGHKTGKAIAATPLPASSAAAASAAEALSTPEARYEAWLMALTRYYGQLGVPAPVRVDGDAFDVLLAPPPPTAPTA